MSLASITRSGSNLQVNSVTKKFSGANAYWLGLDDNNGVGSGSFPTKAQITNSLQAIRTMGGNLVRAHTIGISTGTSNSYEPTVGTYSDSNLDAADWAVAEAGRLGIYLMIPLTDNWNYYHGGKWNFVHWAYQQNSSGITDTPGSTKDDVNERQFFANTTPGLRIRALFKDYISHWLNHVNAYTGIAYKDDPTIAILETGNEIYYAAQLGNNEWTQDIASYIKGIASSKLVADGSASNRTSVSNMPGLTASSVDIVGAHYYPQTQSGSYPTTTFNDSVNTYSAGSAIQQLSADVSSATSNSRAFILGEYPWTRSDINSWYSAIESNSGIDADMYWSFIPNTTSGTPETHGGSFGGDDFSVHTPYSGTSEQTYAPALAAHMTKQAGYMTLRVAKISGSVASNGKLRVVKISGTTSTPLARLRLVKISGNVVTVKPTVRITKISGATTKSATLQTFSTITAKSFDTVTITPQLMSGATPPTSYNYTLIPNTDVSTLPITIGTSSATFVAPGRFNGCSVQIKVDALNGTNVIDSKTATTNVGPHSLYMYRNNAWLAIKDPVKITV